MSRTRKRTGDRLEAPDRSIAQAPLQVPGDRGRPRGEKPLRFVEQDDAERWYRERQQLQCDGLCSARPGHDRKCGPRSVQILCGMESCRSACKSFAAGDRCTFFRAPGPDGQICPTRAGMPDGTLHFGTSGAEYGDYPGTVCADKPGQQRSQRWNSIPVASPAGAFGSCFCVFDAGLYCTLTRRGFCTPQVSVSAPLISNC
jgi:hypothetical protein